MKTVVVGIISRMGEDGSPRYLMVRSRRDFGEFTGCWYPPGGHVEAGESECEALVREVREELGLSVEPLAKLAETPGDVPDQVTCWWQADAAGEISLDDSELAEVGWFAQQEMASMPLWPATKKFFERHVFAYRDFTAVRAVIEDSHGRLLVLRESVAYEGGAHPGWYDFPGGKVQPGESLEQALRREVREECDLEVEVNGPFFESTWYPVVKGVPLRIRGTFFACNAREGEVKLGLDHDDFLWLDPKDASGLKLLPENLEALDAWLENFKEGRRAKLLVGDADAAHAREKLP